MSGGAAAMNPCDGSARLSCWSNNLPAHVQQTDAAAAVDLQFQHDLMVASHCHQQSCQLTEL